jgi:hypothetical protein
LTPASLALGFDVKAREVQSLAISEDELFETANFHPRTTGLPFVVWFSGDPIASHHRPRGKVRVGSEFYPFSLDAPVEWLDKPAPGVSTKNFAELARFVELNRPALLAYWHGQIDTSELASRLQAVR